LGRRTVPPLRQATLAQLQEHLRDVLPAPLLSSEEDGPNSRQRVFSLRLTLECFVWQMLRPKTSCREVVRQVQALFRLRGQGPVDAGDSAYVQARQRRPKDRLEKALGATARAAEGRVKPGNVLQGRPVKVVDCSTVQLPDTRANQRRYPQPGGQKPGCGFPIMKFLVLFSLASGAVLNVVMTGYGHHSRAPRPPHHAGDPLAGPPTLPGRRTDGPLLPPVAFGVVSARLENHPGAGTVAVPVPGAGPKGTPGRSGRPQPDALCYGPSGDPT
jgi:hypothetical protein